MLSSFQALSSFFLPSACKKIRHRVLRHHTFLSIDQCLNYTLQSLAQVFLPSETVVSFLLNLPGSQEYALYLASLGAKVGIKLRLTQLSAQLCPLSTSCVYEDEWKAHGRPMDAWAMSWYSPKLQVVVNDLGTTTTGSGTSSSAAVGEPGGVHGVWQTRPQKAFSWAHDTQLNCLCTEQMDFHDFGHRKMGGVFPSKTLYAGPMNESNGEQPTVFHHWTPEALSVIRR